MFKICLFVIIIYVLPSLAQEVNLTGTLMGKVIDAENKLPLPGANVYLKGQNKGAVTDVNGNYSIKNLPVNSYTVVYSYVGYNSFSASDIIIRSDRITYQDAELFASGVLIDSVVVTGGYFSNVENKPVSTIEYSAEEIRRAPGSAGDVSRILFGLPSIAKLNDGKNSLIVRGGSPVENAFYVDNIEVSNINHFASQGSSDGLFGILNIDFVKNVVFNAGGFSPVYGDKLSSVMEISLREGNRDEYDGQFNLNFGGIGGQFEGPFPGKKGSFLISANKSSLDLLMKAFAHNYPAPEYYDAQTKVVYDLSENNKLSLIDIFANDTYNVSYRDAFDNEFNQYGDTRYITNTTGIEWLCLWGGDGYSNTTISNLFEKRDIFLYTTKSQNKYLSNKTAGNNISLRNVNFFKLSNRHKIEFGIESKLSLNNFDCTFFDYRDEYGNILPAAAVSNKLNLFGTGIFSVYHFTFFNDFTLKAGGRMDYSGYNNKLLFSPRGTLTFNFNPLTSISISAGIFYQNLPSLVLAQSDTFKQLKTPKAVHYIISVNRLLNEDTRLTAELFQKDYSNLPIDPSRPGELLFDQIVSNGIFTNHLVLSGTGKAFSRGIEIMVQKKLAVDFYGMLSASYSVSRYRDLKGEWRSRIYDGRYNFNIEGGYKPDNEWEFSLRYIYAGGAPYTQFDTKLSEQYDTGILDLTRINGSRLPVYHSLNVRFDKRFYFEKTNLVVFLSIWNVYNRDNVSAYVWNEVKNKIAEVIGWNTIPVFGLEYEF